VRASYGPFSPELKSAVTHLENNGLIVEERRGRMFEVRLGSTFESAERAVGDALTPYEGAIERLVDLFSRMKTPDAEVAASVHFAWSDLARTGGHPSEEAVVGAVMDWKARRRPPLERAVVAQATRSLNLLGWIQATPSKELTTDLDTALSRA
jgi:hypothetical protein